MERDEEAIPNALHIILMHREKTGFQRYRQASIQVPEVTCLFAFGVVQARQIIKMKQTWIMVLIF
jgi:hypothetical protein